VVGVIIAMRESVKGEPEKCEMKICTLSALKILVAINQTG
jgi:hypothetical protein